MAISIFKTYKYLIQQQTGSYNWQEWRKSFSGDISSISIDAIVSIYAVNTVNALPTNPLKDHHALYKGDPRLLEGERSYSTTYDTAKEARILGIKFRTMADTTRDTLEDSTKRTW